MFEEFYGFKNTPFSKTVPSTSLYTGNDTNEIVDRLKYAAKKQLFAVLTGDSGTGKSTLLRRFHDEIQNTGHKTIYLSDSKLTPRYFYNGILEQIGAEAKYFRGDAKRCLHREIEIMKGVHGLLPVVIVDESHLLAKEMLEEIRFLLNFKMDSENPMALILSGQSEIWEKLRLQSYTAIRQRIDIQCTISSLDKHQASGYMQAHMAYAGCDRDIFSDAAIDDIFKFSGGVPRLINKICTGSLLFGAQNRKAIIDDRMVKLVFESEFS